MKMYQFLEDALYHRPLQLQTFSFRVVFVVGVRGDGGAIMMSVVVIVVRMVVGAVVVVVVNL